MGCSQKALVLVHPALLSVFGGSVCWAGDRFALDFVWTTTIDGELGLKAQVGFEPLSVCPCWGGAEQARCFLHCAVHVWKCWQELKWTGGSRRCWAPASKAKSELQRNGLLHAIEVASFFSVDVTSFDKWLFHETELLSEVVQWALVCSETTGWKRRQCIIIRSVIASEVVQGCWVVFQQCWAALAWFGGQDDEVQHKTGFERHLKASAQR